MMCSLLQVIYDVRLEPETPVHEIRKRSSSQRLRIHLHYDYSIDGLPYSHRTLIRVGVRVLDIAKYWPQKRLSFISWEMASLGYSAGLECGRSRVQSLVKDRVIPKTLQKWYQ